MFNFNMNNNKKNTFVSNNLNKYYEKAKENIKRANILFPTMKNEKDELEDEINEWKKSREKTNQDKTINFGGGIEIPKEETESERITRLANSLYPTMKDKKNQLTVLIKMVTIK